MAKKKDSGVTIPEIIWTNDLVWQLWAPLVLPSIDFFTPFAHQYYWKVGFQDSHCVWA